MCFGSVFPGHVPCGKRVTVGYRFPLGPHFGEPFGVLGRGADVCEKGEGVLAQIGKVRVKAPFATAVDVGHCDVRLEGVCVKEEGGLAHNARFEGVDIAAVTKINHQKYRGRGT